MTTRCCLVGVLTAIILLGPAHAEPWRPAHVVVVIEENHGYEQIIGNADAAFINELAAGGALFTNSHALLHPSQPNYLALFSGSTQGVTDDRPVPGTPLTGPDLGAALIAKGYTFAGYSEGLPAIGSLSLAVGDIYARKHNPWSDWQTEHPGPNQLPSSINKSFKDFPSAFEDLPIVAFVVPGQMNDEHGNGRAADADSSAWVKSCSPYACERLLLPAILRLPFLTTYRTMTIAPPIRPNKEAPVSHATWAPLVEVV